jgi:hypothetical protein
MNCSPSAPALKILDAPSLVAVAHSLFGKPTHEFLNAITIITTEALADTGATPIFIIEGVDVVNKHQAKKPLLINMPDGRQMQSTHVCNITIPGLPTILSGHIVPHLTVASLLGIDHYVKPVARYYLMMNIAT